MHGDHVYGDLDEKYKKGFKGTVPKMTPGAHRITVKVADPDH